MKYINNTNIRSMSQKIFVVLSLVFVIVGCNSAPTPEKKDVKSHSFLKAYVKSYGAHYAGRGISQNVVDLDLYSAGVDLDSTHHIVGTGGNLYVSDIFLPAGETRLTEGTYRSDTTGAAYTFLPGVDYDGAISGAYLLQISEGGLSSYTIFNEGQFVLSQDADSTYIQFTFTYNENGVKRKYEAEYRGIINY